VLLLDTLPDPLDLILVAEAVEHDARALGGKSLRDGKADAARRAGDDRAFSFERHALTSSFPDPFRALSTPRRRRVHSLHGVI
jgi:hypothetical protein